MLNNVYQVKFGDRPARKGDEWIYTGDSAHHGGVSVQEAREIAVNKFLEGHRFVMVFANQGQALMADETGVVSFGQFEQYREDLQSIEEALKGVWQKRFQA